MFLFLRIKVLFALVFILAIFSIYYQIFSHCINDAQAKPSHKKAKVSTNDETFLWHLRLGHINQNKIERLVKDGPLNSLEVKPLPTCESCLEGKMTKRVLPKKVKEFKNAYN